MFQAGFESLHLMNSPVIHQKGKSEARGVMAATALATALLIGSGLAYRAVADMLGRSPHAKPLPKGTLARLPLALGDWQGKDEPLDEAIIRATDTDDLINRIYVRRGGLEAVSLFLAYGVRLRDMMPHRPQVCYPGAGWTRDRTRELDLRLPDGSSLPCQIHRFVRAGLDGRRITVLNYYLVNGQYSADVSLLRSRIWRPAASASYVAQVQIAADRSRLGGDEEESVTKFAIDSGIAIRSLLPGPAEGGA